MKRMGSSMRSMSGLDWPAGSCTKSARVPAPSSAPWPGSVAPPPLATPPLPRAPLLPTRKPASAGVFLVARGPYASAVTGPAAAALSTRASASAALTTAELLPTSSGAPSTNSAEASVRKRVVFQSIKCRKGPLLSACCWNLTGSSVGLTPRCGRGSVIGAPCAAGTGEAEGAVCRRGRRCSMASSAPRSAMSSGDALAATSRQGNGGEM
mmetsp:Transcript_144902/g.361409  ORF Transcript_144902/g.361409 Transcript_144902/m.361409 type:complete len:210 (+) Transcript_144902:149-778(+)